MEHEKLIKQEAAKAFKVNEEEVIVKHRFLGGMSHLTYHIEIHGVDYTFRVIGKDGNLFVDRKIEYQNLKTIEQLGLCNETVYFDIESGEKAAKYVEGTPLSQLDFKPYLSDVAKTLKKLHHTHLKPASDYGLINRLNLYETYTNNRLPQYLELKKAWINIYENERKDKPKVFCHNDAQRSNFVIAPDKVYLLDWEYAGYNEFYYDIASFGNVQFEDALELLDVYLEREATVEEKNLVRYYRMFQALQWHQVALRKEIIGLSPVLHFDFKMLAEKYLNLAQKLYDDIKG
ncbi:MAG: choline kinase family protein [Acholeplasmataceae bacterium]|nr:choline kinase family protein [Acholeplasmataceae bacterium]MDD4193705.1 choline kinase family protein [Acholeplasmataceae bacterium]